MAVRYSIRDESGHTIDGSPNGEPWYFLHGAKACPPGLEQALVGHRAGDRVEVKLPPEETYGPKNESAAFRIARANLPRDAEPAVGMILCVMSPQGETELRVVEVSDTEITVDPNHPLAGQTLTFDVEIVDVRPASAAEILSGEPRTGDGHADTNR